VSAAIVITHHIVCTVTQSHCKQCKLHAICHHTFEGLNHNVQQSSPSSRNHCLHRELRAQSTEHRTLPQCQISYHRLCRAQNGRGWCQTNHRQQPVGHGRMTQSDTAGRKDRAPSHTHTRHTGPRIQILSAILAQNGRGHVRNNHRQRGPGQDTGINSHMCVCVYSV
jgi:hypothetical protein